jgi:2-amino-4-hydroxy-6-hydroxymethyldihydropteridine diphosphokinase
MNTLQAAGERVFVALGANLGDAQATVLQAFDELGGLPSTVVVARSSLYRTAPVEAEGPDFYNAVAELRTTLEPLPLLQALHAIEDRHGRERPFLHAPRTLDLDLLLYGLRLIDKPGLSVPHPRLQQRAFALLPLLEIDPQLVHPLLGPLQPMVAAVQHQASQKL